MSAAAPAQPLRLPAVDRVLSAPAFRALAVDYGTRLTTDTLRGVMDALRPAVVAGQATAEQIEPAALATQVRAQLESRFAPRLKAVFNLTGTVLHTNLGRALLPDAAVQAVVQALTTPANLEFDLATGGRGDRDDLVNDLLRELTGAITTVAQGDLTQAFTTTRRDEIGALARTLNEMLDRLEVAAARQRAEENGRRYPNLVDNMWAAKLPRGS